MVYCRKGDRYGKGLFIESGESVEDVVGDTNQSPEYDVGGEGEEELIQGDEGPLLIVRKGMIGVVISSSLFVLLGVRYAGLRLIQGVVKT